MGQGGLGPGGPSDFSTQYSAWLSGVWHPGMGARHGSNQTAWQQRCGTVWNVLPEGSSGRHYAGASEPLCSHLNAETRVKIWRGWGYVNLFSLLFWEPEPKPGVSGFIVVREQEQYRHPKVTRT